MVPTGGLTGPNCSHRTFRVASGRRFSTVWRIVSSNVPVPSSNTRETLAISTPDWLTITASKCPGFSPCFQKVVFGSGGRVRQIATKVYERTQLKAGNVIAGPALVEQMDSTTVIPPGAEGKVDAYGNLIVTLARK